MTTMIESTEPMPPQTESLLRRVEELEKTVGALRDAAARDSAAIEANIEAAIEERVAEKLARDEAALEQRVLERLSTQDTAVIENRLFERIAARVPSATVAVPVAAPVLPPPPISTPSGPRWYDRLNPFKPRAIVPPPVSSGWLLFDMLNEARFLGSMIFDSRFSTTWASRLVMMVCLGALLFVGLLDPLGWIPILGTYLGHSSFLGGWLDRAFTLLVAFFLFKVLSRETARYRAYLAMLENP
jgi:hypothetical protein